MTLALVSCNGRQGRQYRDSFPIVDVPSVIMEPEERAVYAQAHYWEEFFALDGPTDTAAVLGVPTEKVEQALADFVRLSAGIDLEEAQAGVLGLFSALERKQSEDTASKCYRVMCDLVSKYLYDPNSPVRDEDLYLPFVRAAAVSGYTSEDMRPAYEYETRMCELNRRGMFVPEFKIRKADGTQTSLYAIKAGYTLLCFNNPDCADCKTVQDQIQSRSYISARIASGDLAVVSVYIDEDVRTWRKHVKAYPDNWVVGYDPKMVIRTDELYNVRAIPSLYLLDREKKVVLKDAPVERVLQYLDNLFGE